MTNSPLFPILLFIVIFPLLWISVIRFAAFLGGWRTLANSYQVEARMTDGVLKGKSGYMRFFTRYNYVLHIKGTDEGLYLATALFFRPGHPPLLIPWDRFANAEVSKLLFTFIKLDIATSQYSDEDVIKVSFYGRGIGDTLVPFLEKHGLISAENTP